MNDLATLLKCPFLYFIGFIGVFTYISYQSYKKSSAAWYTFAKLNKLTFLPGSYLTSKSAKVIGSYHYYKVQLDSYYGDKEEYTQLRLWIDPSTHHEHFHHNKSISVKPPDSESIVNLLLPTAVKQPIKGQIFVQKNGQEIIYQQQGLETDTKYLQLVLSLLCRLGDAYPMVVALGGESVPALQSIILNKDYQVLKQVAGQLLYAIGQETEKRLKQRASHLLCPHCLVRCDTHQVSLPGWNSITYYGCRVCGQSQEFLNLDQWWVVAVLDAKSTSEQCKYEGQLRVNWLIKRNLFDFDEVEIVAATDEEVERFAVQVGNDTDSLRKPRYQQMKCVVSRECRLSENTMRILRRIFGDVQLSNSGSS